MPKPKVRVLRPGGLGFRNAFENGVRCLPVRHVRWIPLSMYPNPSSSQILKIVGDILILCPFYPSIPVYHHHPFVKSGEIAEITTFSVSQFVLVKSPCFNMCHSFCLVESPFFYEKNPHDIPKKGKPPPLVAPRRQRSIRRFRGDWTARPSPWDDPSGHGKCWSLPRNVWDDFINRSDGFHQEKWWFIQFIQQKWWDSMAT